VTGQIYVDNEAPPEVRASAQGLIALVTYGAGMVIGNFIAGLIYDWATIEGGHNWKAIWIAPAVMAIVVTVLFALLFREKAKANKAAAETA
ncbi:MAG: MFS transporter, partial [Candidatus Hydrogenedentes bacterium]|nr:MFS transporter [Candidatus Hydrogenedentota bacterium]